MGALGMMGENGNRLAFANLLENLYKKSAGPHAGPNLRIGGNSADESCFRANQQKKMPNACDFIINTSQLLAYKKFASSTAHAANISFVIDTNFGLSPDPTVRAFAGVYRLSFRATRTFLSSLMFAIHCINRNCHTYCGLRRITDPFTCSLSSSLGLSLLPLATSLH